MNVFRTVDANDCHTCISSLSLCSVESSRNRSVSASACICTNFEMMPSSKSILSTEYHCIRTKKYRKLYVFIKETDHLIDGFQLINEVVDRVMEITVIEMSCNYRVYYFSENGRKFEINIKGYIYYYVGFGFQFIYILCLYIESR